MNTLLLNPTDVLFFRDGRPMGGSLSGHGAAWPLPHVISHALHAALHRAGFPGVHEHRRGRSGDYQDERDRKFGSLVSVGPFPVCTNGSDHTWFFTRPLDAGLESTAKATLLPLAKGYDNSRSSLPGPLLYPVANTVAAEKLKLERWFSEGAFNDYIGIQPRTNLSGRNFYKNDSDFADTEFSYGIGMNAETGTQDGERFYSASYLRLKEGWRLGVLAVAPDKDFRHPIHGNDLMKALLNGHGTEIIAGGQQRVCTATLQQYEGSALPIPAGMRNGFATATAGGSKRWLVKWVLLTPAIWPKIGYHAGGWIPSWVSHTDGRVLLKSGDTGRAENEGRRRWRERVAAMPATIAARLVAAMVGKPLPVAGYALPNTADPDRSSGGGTSTHLAAPAGSVYYFEADSEEDAAALAAALNWHGATDGTQIKNRRSTLIGEKGFGIGVCGTWQFHSGDVPGRPNP